MHNEERRDRQLDFLDVGVRQAITRRLRCQDAAVQHVKARGGAVALSLDARSRGHDEEDGERVPQRSAKHGIPRLFLSLCAAALPGALMMRQSSRPRQAHAFGGPKLPVWRKRSVKNSTPALKRWAPLVAGSA